MPPEVAPQEVAAKPLVSVVIVSNNCEADLRRCLQALESAPSRERFEVLVVDAGSTDGCPRIDTEFPGITLLRLPRNFGKTRARNIGTRTGQAELVLYLDPRVELSPNAVESLASALETRPDAAAVAPCLQEQSGGRVSLAFRLPAPSDLADAAFRRVSLPRDASAGEAAEAVDDLCLLVRRNFLQGMNYLDEKRFSDHWALLDVFWQIRNAGKKILLVEQAAGTVHPASQPTDLRLEKADSVTGAGAFVAKRCGFAAGISFKLKCFFKALGSFQLPLAIAIATGRRVDPT